MRRLLDEAAAGHLETGALLPRELDLAERFGVSRGVVRDTIQALRERGVVEVRHGSGARLLPEEAWRLLDEDVLAVLIGRPERGALRREVIEALAGLEPTATALAAARAGEEDRAALAVALSAMSATPGLTVAPGFVTEAPAVRAQAAFHDRLMAAADNRPLRQMARPLHLGLAVMAHVLLGRTRRSRLVEAHVAVLDRVAASDAEGARDAVEHLLEQLADWVAPAS